MALETPVFPPQHEPHLPPGVDPEEWRKTHTYEHYITACIDLTAGAAGGTANVMVGQPLDTIKVKMQTFPEFYKSSLLCFRQTIAKEGFRGLYAGTVPALAANIAENSVLFCAYGVCQKLVQKITKTQKVEELGPLSNATAGFLAAFFSSFSLCPTELIKCRLQAMRETSLLEGNNSTVKNIGPWSLTKQILRDEGITGMFRGLVPTFAREMPGYFFFFGGYEFTRSALTPAGKTKDEIGPLRTIIAGGVGGVCLWVSIFPTDVIKSRVQVQGSKENMIFLMRKIVRTEGILALYSGLGPTVLRTFPSTGALFLAYEYTKKLLHYATGVEPC
ncbi:mitochondrial ornithine transporter 1-like [Limulus polyphemus]|uniref:Mitochondrial ornithine transporter 1-like n=1 Tax=Limulus polyphemus TaxID=6850 RepID=A0ABM1SUA2_LIMPO|nr:mitochondrial ornithine transporter 1-like [Limulus polyphemus]XP_022247208.1 mitochondrial ornithine transporter 1-like [Limulus polyphemus]